MTEQRKVQRFILSDRIEHLVLLLSFGLLGLTGLIQKFHTVAFSEWLVGALGGIESVRVIHRVAAVVMMLQTIYHIGTAGYKIFVLRVRLSMLPGIRDLRNAIGSVMYNLGRRKERPQQGRYTWGEKLEYWAVVWGTIVMGITGFILWNPIVAARLLPGQIIPAAKAAHGGEALLAVLAIIIWHIYNVHIRHFNPSMFTGYISEHDMEELHPLELEEIKIGVADAPMPKSVLKRRRSLFFAVYVPLALVMLVAVYLFVNVEDTAIATVPPPEDVVAFAPLTPTPVPTPLPTPEGGLALLPVDAAPIPHLVAGREECRSCHGDDSMPEDHTGRGNDLCQVCHAPVPVPAILHPVEGHEECLDCHGEGQVAEFTLDTHSGRDDASCMSCHDLAGVVPLMIPHVVEDHEDCLACHGPEAFAPYPDTHEGWGNQFCLLCHNANPALAEVQHPFPQDHDGAGGNCTLCHADGDLTSYTCDTCHAPAIMEQAHSPRGIVQTAGQCVLCHPTGEKP